jgi:hypothetical protein
MSFITRSVCALATVAAMGLITPAIAKTPTIVAVFTVQAKGITLAPDRLERLSDYLASQIAAGARYRVVPRAQLQRRLKAQKRASYRKCIDQSCQIEIGKELAAQKTLSTEIIKLGSKCVVTGTLYDLRTAATERAATHKGACGADALVASLEQVAKKLTQLSSGAATPPPAPATNPVTTKAPRVTVDFASSPSGAEIFLDGRSRGRTPKRLELVKGRRYALNLEKSGYSSHKASVLVKDRETLRYRLALTQAGRIDLATRTEWFSFGGFIGTPLGEGGAGFSGGLTMAVFGLKWRHFFLTPLEGIVASPQSDGGLTLFVGSLAGYPLYFGPEGQHQLRFGLGLGVGNVRYSDATLIIRVSSEYSYQTKGRLFFGVGLDLLAPVSSGQQYRSATDDYAGGYNLALGLRLRMGWASKPD